MHVVRHGIPAGSIVTWRPRWLTYDEAARRAGVSAWTVQEWRRADMPMTTDKAGRRVVREDVLLEWKVRRLRANPARSRKR